MSQDLIAAFQVGSPNDIVSIANVGGQYVSRTLTADITLAQTDMGKTWQFYSDTTGGVSTSTTTFPFSVILPPATQLTVGPNIVGFENQGDQPLLIRDNAGTLLAILKPNTPREVM